MNTPATLQPAILLTGATGFLGGRLLVRLLGEHRHVIVLCRGRPLAGLEARSRLARRLAELGSGEHAGRVEVIDADLARITPAPLACDLLGALQRLDCARVVLVNVAASLKMDHAGQDAERRAATRRINQDTNVRGLQSLLAALDLIEPGQDQSAAAPPVLSGVVHFSTCYAHGRRRGPLPEAPLGDDSGSQNSYESTKRQGEAVLAQWQARRRHPVAVTVLRPSIVTGPDTDDGYVAWIDALAEGAGDGSRAIDRLAAGLRRWRLPWMPLPGNPTGVLDLIDAADVEHYGHAVVRHHLDAVQAPGMRYLQLANPDSPTLRRVADLTLAALGQAGLSRRLVFLRGLRLFAVLLRAFACLPLAGPALRGVIRRTEMLRPYLLRPPGTRFETHRTAAYFAERGLSYAPRRIDAAYVRSLVTRRAARAVDQAAPWPPGAAIEASGITIECPRSVSLPALTRS